MRYVAGPTCLVVLLLCCAATALATPSTSAHDVQAALARYLASDTDKALVGGTGQAGYEDGFWIRGGDFTLKTNLLLQARFEAWRWADGASGTQGLPGPGPQNGGDLSGFSLPRASLRLSGQAPCDLRYYVEIAFDHVGADAIDARRQAIGASPNLGTFQQSRNYDSTREAWIEWRMSSMLHVRAGQIPLATTRQLMTKPEHQQFADVSLAAAFLGSTMPGYTDRNRDFGVALHGRFGGDDAWSYLLTVTNGDGADSIRNVLDHRTSDNVALGLRLNWAFLKPIGYREGALHSKTCGWAGEIGGWVFYYEDRIDKPHTQVADSIRYGLDIAVTYGGISFTGALAATSTEVVVDTDDVNYIAYLAQVGYHFVGTPWEIAVRYSGYEVDNVNPSFAALPGSQHPLSDGGVYELGAVISYCLDAHRSKISLDFAFVSGQDATSQLLFDPYTGYAGVMGTAGTGADDFGALVRFQWQLSL